MNISENLVRQALKKAVKCPKNKTYRVIALGFNKKGDYIGMRSNERACLDKRGMGRGKGIHAERQLIKKYGKTIRKIVIIRSGRQKDILPIAPCPICQKVIDKLNIKVESYDV